MQNRVVATCVLLLAVLLLAEFATAAFRKPPFNGSIFGKRGSPTDYDGASKALSAMCEIASEACSAWFPQMDN
ncbi:neuropeptide SIFamide [Zootermopsis nevadensis]|uniref:neuropeptide SIFamide n=1 Tax=Zootermopsis nevadensis TaxID=136037 RepID=UPI000B8E8FE0|nr:neuropeptide SIFamide [Zootermopsis nevadensis]